MQRSDIERLLETYSLDEILELNDTDIEACILYMIEEGFLSVPEVRPLGIEDEVEALETDIEE